MLHSCRSISFVMIDWKTKWFFYFLFPAQNLNWKNWYKKKKRNFPSPSPFRPGGPTSLPRAPSWAAAQLPAPLLLVADGWGPPVRTIFFPNRRPDSLSHSVGKPPGSAHPAPPTFPPRASALSWRKPRAPEPFSSPTSHSPRLCSLPRARCEKPSPEFFVGRAKPPSRAVFVDSRRVGELPALPRSLPVLLPCGTRFFSAQPRSPESSMAAGHGVSRSALPRPHF